MAVESAAPPDGAVLRSSAFGTSGTGKPGGGEERRNTVVLKLPAGEYFQRFGVAMAGLAILS